MNNIINWFKSGTMVVKLLGINIAFFLLVGIVGVFINFSGYPGQNGLVAILSANSSVLETLSRPWSIITYMFLHQGIWHLFWNMYILFFAGRLFSSFLQENRVLPTYLLGGLAGLALYMICYNIFPLFTQHGNAAILGASASVIAILVAVATYVPNYSVVLMFLGPVKLKYIAIAFVALDFMSLQNSGPGSNIGGHIAHLGGALYGFFMANQLTKGNDWSLKVNRFLMVMAAIFKRKPKIRVVHNKKKTRPVSDQEFNTQKKAKQEQIDRILDKISKSGYDSLTKEEKALLFQVSNEQ
jgi:membrane associated rhomboid family serine protease